MRRSELIQVFNDFKSVRANLSSLQFDDEADFEREKAKFQSLLCQLRDHLDLLDEDQKEVVISSSSLAFRHRLKLTRVRARSLSESRISTLSQSEISVSHSTDSSFSSSSSLLRNMDSDATKNTDENVGGKDVIVSGAKDATQRKSLLQLQFQMEDVMDSFEDERRLLERKCREQRRALLLEAESQGLEVDALLKTTPSIDPPQPAVPVVSELAPQSTTTTASATATTTNASAAAAAASSDHLLQLLGSQRLKNSKPSESERFGGGAAEYAQFEVKFKSEVLDLSGVTDAERFVSLQERTKDRAREIVNNFVYLEDKSKALEEALKELKFFFGKRTGSAQSMLTKIIDGKEVNPNSVEAVEGLLQELQKMAAFARAMKEDSFLELEATVLSIVREKFGHKMKGKFSNATDQAEKE